MLNLWLTGLFAGLFGLPLFAADGDSMFFRLSQDDRRIKIRMEGKFTLTADGTGFASLSRNARMRFEEEDGATVRRLDVEPAADGGPVYTWKVDGEKRAFDAEARKWLQEILVAARLAPPAPASGPDPRRELPDPR